MKIYLDNAATTYVDKAVMNEMIPYFTEVFGNASSQHSFGRDAKKGLDAARDKIAAILGASPNEIYFTSGGSESDNWAVKGIAYAYAEKGKHIITSSIEHPAVMKSCKYLESRGYDVTYLPVDNSGIVDIEALKLAIRKDTILISIMAANNEIGTIQPIDEIASIAHSNGVLFHTDAVQAIGALHFDVHTQKIDLLSLSAHKFYGPKGIGVLYIRNGIKIDRYMSGGEQERARRAGTSATPQIVGMAKALELAYAEFDERNSRQRELRDYFIDRLSKEVPYCIINGSRDKRLSNNISASFEFIEGESLLLLLDLEGIAASSGSACSSGSLEPSYVLLAIGLPIEKSHGTLRFTSGKDTTKEQIDYTIEKITEKVNTLRQMSPLFAEFKGGYNV